MNKCAKEGQEERATGSPSYTGLDEYCSGVSRYWRRRRRVGGGGEASSSPWLVLEFLPRHILQRILGRVRPASSDLVCSNMAEDGRRVALYLLVLCLVIFCSVFFLARLRHGSSGLYCTSMEGEVRRRVALHLVLREPDQFPSPQVSSILTTH